MRLYGVPLQGVFRYNRAHPTYGLDVLTNGRAVLQPIFCLYRLNGTMALNLQSLLEETVPGLGYELVDVEFGSRGLLRVFIDRPEGISIDDCVAVSNHLTRLFMVENIEYERLEVSSPGMDRPLKKPADFERFAGERVRVKLRVPLEDRRRHFVGKLVGLVDGNVTIESDGETLSFPRQTVDRVRLDPEFPQPGANKKKTK